MLGLQASAFLNRQSFQSMFGRDFEIALELDAKPDGLLHGLLIVPGSDKQVRRGGFGPGPVVQPRLPVLISEPPISHFGLRTLEAHDSLSCQGSQNGGQTSRDASGHTIAGEQRL